MTAIKPRIGYDSTPYANRNGVWASSEETGSEGFRSCDWGAGTLWEPKATQQLLDNGDLLVWTAGPSAAPDDWALVGADGAVAQDTTPHHGLYGATITRAGVDCWLIQSLSTWATYVGRKVTVGVWAKTAVASHARILLNDGVAAQATTHTGAGGGVYEWLAVSMTLAPGADRLEVRMDVINTNGAASFTHPIIVLGATVDQTPVEPETAILHVVPGFGDGSNLLTNGYMRDWTAGVAAAPDNWALTGASATVALRADIVKIGMQSMAITRSGTDCYGSQTLSAADLAKVVGRQLSLGGHVYATVASRARLAIAVTLRDSSTVSVEYDGYNDGDTDWDWESFTTAEPIPYDATAVEVRCYVDTGNTTAFFDGLSLQIGTSVLETPLQATADYLAIAGHDLGATGNQLILEGTNLESSGYTTVATLTPADDRAKWIDFASITYRFWRIRIPSTSGSQPAILGVVAFGKYLEFPEFPELGFDLHGERMVDDLALARDGFPVGRNVLKGTKNLVLSFTWVDESFITGDYQDFKDHAGPRGNPGGLSFFLQYDDGDHGTVTLFCWLPKNARLPSPLDDGGATQRLDIRMQAMAE